MFRKLNCIGKYGDSIVSHCIGKYDDSVVSTTEESAAEKEMEKEKACNKKILIVDDEPDITFTLRTVLEENGFKEVDVYNEPLLALQNFKSINYRRCYAKNEWL